MISFEEKIQAQEKIIEELFDFIMSKRPTEAFLKANLFKKLKEIVIIEAKYYGLKYNDKFPKTDFYIEIDKKSESSTLGGFSLKKGKPKISMYYDNDAYIDILSKDVEERIEALKSILEVLFHELDHLNWYLIVKECPSNKEALAFAKEISMILFSSSFNVKYREVYNSNHDLFMTEAQAKISGKKVVDRLTNSKFKTQKDLKRLTINKANKARSEFIVDDKIIKREDYIDNEIDRIIRSDVDKKLFAEMPILLKEYNQDGTKKTISELLSNMYNELNVAEDLENEEDKKKIINETKEFYYYLIYKRLLIGDPFEIYDAIKEYSKKELEDILEYMKEYKKNEKDETLKLFKEKYKTLNDKVYDEDGNYSNIFNKGKIKINTLDGVKLVTSKEYALKLLNELRKKATVLSESEDYRELVKYEGEQISISNNKACKYEDTNDLVKDILFSSKLFCVLIPDYGTYILKDGNVKKTINEFIDEIFLPEYNQASNRGNILLKYHRCVMKYCKLSVDAKYTLTCEQINKEYQESANDIDNILKSDIFKTENIEIDDSIYNLMKVVCHFDQEKYQATLIYLMFDGIDIDSNEYTIPVERIIFFKNILDAAKELNKNKLFNPDGIDYYTKFISNDIIINIVNTINNSNNNDIIKFN